MADQPTNNKRNSGDRQADPKTKGKPHKKRAAKVPPASRFKAVTKGLEIAGSIASVIAFFPAFFHGFYSLALWLGVSFLILVVWLRWGISRLSIATAFVAIVCGGVTEYFLPEQEKVPFSIGIETVLVGNTRDASVVGGEFGGHFVTPIPLMLFVQVVNVQDIPSTVSDLRVQVESGSNWWGLRRKWLTMSQLPGYMPLLMVGPSGPPRRVEMIGSLLGPILQERSLGPHETIRGWLLFDAPEEFDSAPRPLTYRIRVTDSAGRGVSFVFSKTEQMGNMLPDRGFQVGEPVEIQNLTVRHFSYPN